MKRVIWTPTALASLQETTDFISKLWNEEIVDQFLIQLDLRIDQIQRNPQLAPQFEHSEIRRLLIHSTVSLFYLELSDFLQLLLVWDNRQEPKLLHEKLRGQS